MPTESELQPLFHRPVEVLDHEGASTLIDVVSPFARNELATKADVAVLRSDMADLRTDMAELRGDLRAEMAELKHDLTRSLGGWLFVSQFVLVAIVAMLVSLR